MLRGMLYDVYVGTDYLFWDLKALCNALGIDYSQMVAHALRNEFYMDRFQVTWFDVPHYVDVTKVKKWYE